MKLREEIRQRVLSDDDMIYEIAKATNKKWRTVFLWLYGNNDKLTLAASLRVIKKYTGLTEDEILTDTEILEDNKIPA